MFDSAGLDYLTIFASNDLNEWKIDKMLLEGAQIGAFGVGTEMGVSLDAPALSGVYKLAECTNREGGLVDKMKMSEGKSTLPGRKQVYRIYDANGRMVKDVIALENEEVQGEALCRKSWRMERDALSCLQFMRQESTALSRLQESLNKQEWMTNTAT